MLEAIYELGKYNIQKNNLNLSNEDDLLEILVENPDSTGSYKHLLIIEFDNKFKFINVNYEEFEKYDKDGNLDVVKYLYKFGSSRGSNFTPSAKEGKEIKGTFNNKILKWFYNPEYKKKKEDK